MSDENMILDELDVEQTDIPVEDIEPDVPIDETVQVIEIEDTTVFTVDSDEAFRALGEPNEQLKHQLLNGRDVSDQHPITAITGLRAELDNIEALQIVYSNEKQSADYYEWEDGNILDEDRVGYFVTLCDDIRRIKICDDGKVFGVIVDSAAFIGGQDDIVRGDTYGLVAHSGVVYVRCESDVTVGDCVVANIYGIAAKTNGIYGYRVVGMNAINGITYAIILLHMSADQINVIGSELSNISERMDDAETNIISAINVANAAHNKASETVSISEEALKNALEAMGKADDAVASTDQMNDVISSVNETAVQARAIAESASVSAEAIRNDAVKTANDALTNVNDLVADLEPITTWTDPESGNSGAEYLTTYINNGLATKAEVQTVETKTDDNKSAIEKNAESIQTIVSSVDKYSVGEYSQAYGLTQEQAQSILKKDMVYIPTKHTDATSHSETFADTGEVNEFTPGYYYTWSGTDWTESSSPLVAFFSEELAPSNALQYWYIDSNEAPDGYEPHALYINDGGQWLKVNVLDGNVNNRITSMIRQTADKIALDVVDAQGNIASHQQWLDENSSNIQDVVSWKSDVENDVSQIATIKQTAYDAGASVALVVAEKDGEKVVNAASIVTAINNGDSSVVIDADHVDISGVDISLKGQTINISADDVLGISSTNFTVDSSGKLWANEAEISGTITANNGDIGEWKIGSGNSSSYFNGIYQDIKTITAAEDGTETVNKVTRVGMKTSLDPTHYAFYVRDFKDVAEWENGVAPTGSTYFAVTQDGRFTATKATITGNITATSGNIGEWTIGSGNSSSYYNGIYSDVSVSRKDANGNDVDTKVRIGMKTSSTASHYAFYIRDFADLEEWENGAAPTGKVYFAVQQNGKLTATDATITGTINATSGTFARDIMIGDRSISNWITEGGYIKEIKATAGSIAGWNISDSVTIPIGANSSVQLPAIYIAGTSTDGIDGVYLTTRGVYIYNAREGYYDYASWRDIIIAANQ